MLTDTFGSHKLILWHILLGVTRIYDWGPGVSSRLPMLIQRKLVLSAYCSPIFLFQVCLKICNFHIGRTPMTPLATPMIQVHCVFFSIILQLDFRLDLRFT